MYNDPLMQLQCSLPRDCFNVNPHPTLHGAIGNAAPAVPGYSFTSPTCITNVTPPRTFSGPRQWFTGTLGLQWTTPPHSRVVQHGEVALDGRRAAAHPQVLVAHAARQHHLAGWRESGGGVWRGVEGLEGLEGADVRDECCGVYSTRCRGELLAKPAVQVGA